MELVVNHILNFFSIWFRVNIFPNSLESAVEFIQYTSYSTLHVAIESQLKIKESSIDIREQFEEAYIHLSIKNSTLFIKAAIKSPVDACIYIN